MDQQRDTVYKTYQFKLPGAPAQEQAVEAALHRCRTLYNTALEQRRTWWDRGQGTCATYDQQKAEVPDLKAACPACPACPDYAEVYSQDVQDVQDGLVGQDVLVVLVVLVRLDRTVQAFFRRLAAGETPGSARFWGRGRYNRGPSPQVGEHGGAHLDTGVLVLSKLGRLAVRWSRPLQGRPKTGTIRREADGWYACISCADVPTPPLPLCRALVSRRALTSGGR
jgi:putative transposase